MCGLVIGVGVQGEEVCRYDGDGDLGDACFNYFSFSLS